MAPIHSAPLDDVTSSQTFCQRSAALREQSRVLVDTHKHWNLLSRLKWLRFVAATIRRIDASPLYDRSAFTVFVTPLMK